jgi:heptosyltransferase-2/heptosyltransferase-3
MSGPPVQPIVIWFGRVGDMILLSALLEIVHRRYRAPCFLIGAGGWPAEIYAGHPDVASVDCLHRYTAFLVDAAWWRTLARLRAQRAAPVYVCESDPRKLRRIRRLLRLAGVPPGHCLFITRDLPAPPPTHHVDRLVGFARLTPAAFSAADYPWPAPPPRGTPRLYVSAGARRACDVWLESQGLAGRELVLLQPGNRRTMRGQRLELSAGDDKAWPLERWGQLLQRLHEVRPQAMLLLCGAPRETLLLSWIADAAHLSTVRIAEVPLPLLFGLCERAHSMISVDTGPAHAAAALSVPLVVLFGAQSQAEWLPRSAGGSAVVGLGGPPQSRRLDEIDLASVFAAWQGLPPRATAAPESAAPLTSTAARAT